MGEDSCKNQASVDKKTNGIDAFNHKNGDSSFANSSTMSTCSEVDSESTSFLEDETDMDYQYGPGIVSKLRTKFLSISLKQNRGNNIRRSCSMENLLDPKPSQRNTNVFVPPNRFLTNGIGEKTVESSWNNLKRAKSMDTLLMSLEASQIDSGKTTNNDIVSSDFKKFKEPKVIRRKDGSLNRPVVSITDEEFPKPDTVKTYKRMFEPAESKKANSNSNVRRRPPVLRATAKSGSNSNIKTGSNSNIKSGSNPIIKTGSNPIIKAGSNPIIKTVSNPIIKTGSTPIIKSGSNPIIKTGSNPIIKSGSNPIIKSGLTTNNKTNGILAPKPISQTNNIKSSAKETPVSDLEPIIKNIEPKIEAVEKATIKTNAYQKKNGVKNYPITSDLTNGTVRAEALQLKVKDEIAKRNFRSSKIVENNRGPKPSVPLRKPVLKTTPKSITAQTKTTTNKITKISPEKPLKSVVTTVKDIEKTTKSENSSVVISVEVKKVLPSPSPVPEDEDNTKLLLKNIEPEIKLLNGFNKPETIEAPPTKDLPVVTMNGNSESKDAKRTTAVNNTMIFDFRGKDVVSHLSISPAPFGCKAAIRKRNVLIDGKESMPYLNGYSNGGEVDSEDEDFVDYSVPAPCGLIFEGENVKIGKGAILATRNKELKIQFDEDVEKSTFVYPSESSFLNDDSSSSLSSSDFSSLDSVDVAKVANGNNLISPKLPTNTAINPSGTGGLMSYTPSVLRTVDNFQPGLFRVQDDKKKKSADEASSQAEGEEENRGKQAQDGDTSATPESSMLKPADPEFISSWSISAGTSDLLF